MKPCVRRTSYDWEDTEHQQEKWTNKNAYAEGGRCKKDWIYSGTRWLAQKSAEKVCGHWVRHCAVMPTPRGRTKVWRVWHASTNVKSLRSQNHGKTVFPLTIFADNLGCAKIGQRKIANDDEWKKRCPASREIDEEVGLAKQLVGRHVNDHVTSESRMQMKDKIKVNTEN